MKTEKESLKSQVDRLANFILEHCEGYPNKNEGAIDCAIRIIKAYATQRVKEANRKQRNLCADEYRKNIGRQSDTDAQTNIRNAPEPL